ncbi:unnamed protein product [Ilex paraguariensis]|uniref:DUF7725 domain-containing protein n=1 Tax=Ilex paraguariensis TaxID=185542 RepID=A0ABC8SSQ2_9AQUA
MEAAAGVAAAGRVVSLPMTSSQPPRKQWRVVSEQSVRHSGNEDLDRSKLGQLDERLIYEVQQGKEPADLDFCSITMDGSLDNDVLEQRLHSVMKQREEVQLMEIDLKAQLIARSEILEMQNTYDAQIKEHANANLNLQGQLHEKDKTIQELERKVEEKERELHAIRLANEAAWAKEDLLREQNKELAAIRRERDNLEAERAQQLKQIHDFQEHVQEKERQFVELQEQHRVAQETILFKDEQLREAQAWISRVQEMDALQSTANHTLQAELHERTEQYNQLWLGCQRQFAEMERLHLHTIQQLQLELADARGRNGTYSDDSKVSQTNSKEVSQYAQGNGSRLEASGTGAPNENLGGLSNGNALDSSSLVSPGSASTQADHVYGVPLAPSLLGVPTYLPPGQVTALHPFVMHQQGVPHTVPSHVAQSHVGHFHSAPAISSLQHWPNQQAVSESSQMPPYNQYLSSQTEQNLLRSDTNYEYEVPVNGEALRPDYMNSPISQGLEPDSVVPSSNGEGQAIGSIDKSYLVGTQPQQSLQQISSQFHDALRLDPLEQHSETQENSTLVNHGRDAQGLAMEQPSSVDTSSLEAPSHLVNFNETPINNAASAILPESYSTNGQKNTLMVVKTAEITLLDERSLLACIVRTIPPGSGGRIRISSTLPNRLGKMLAPLHWHDYKKKYGKLDEFVASHPELFVIEGDYIQLREGAQEIIVATAAVAKVAAAAAAVTSSYSSLLPSVAVTPMAQSHRLKRSPSSDSNSGVPRPVNATDNASELSAMRNQHSNGVSFVGGGVSTVKILSKPKDHMELHGPRPGQSSVLLMAANGVNSERSDFGTSQSKGLIPGQHSANFVRKQQGRTIGTASSSKR